jgi:DNA-binding IclR family transcriptional regulator
MVKKKRKRGESKGKVLETLKDAKGPLTPKQLAAKTRLNRNSVRRLAQELFKEGAITKPERGLYQTR